MENNNEHVFRFASDNWRRQLEIRQRKESGIPPKRQGKYISFFIEEHHTAPNALRGAYMSAEGEKIDEIILLTLLPKDEGDELVKEVLRYLQSTL